MAQTIYIYIISVSQFHFFFNKHFNALQSFKEHKFPKYYLNLFRTFFNECEVNVFYTTYPNEMTENSENDKIKFK